MFILLNNGKTILNIAQHVWYKPEQTTNYKTDRIIKKYYWKPSSYERFAIP